MEFIRNFQSKRNQANSDLIFNMIWTRRWLDTRFSLTSEPARLSVEHRPIPGGYIAKLFRSLRQVISIKELACGDLALVEIGIALRALLQCLLSNQRLTKP